jgi:cytochrome c biogenesis protein CcmG/thiol:disulfide interchange protein DsbE
VSIEPRSTRPARPTRPIAALLGIALVTTIAVIGIGAATRGGGESDVARGKAVPNITGTTLDGGTVDLASLRGRAVLINFWGPSCVPCREEMPLLARKAAEHASSGLVILGVLMDDPVEPARTFEKDFGATWQTVIDPDGAIKRAYHVLSRPQSYFVDGSGILRSIQIGYLTDADFERQLALTVGGS